MEQWQVPQISWEGEHRRQYICSSQRLKIRFNRRQYSTPQQQLLLSSTLFRAPRHGEGGGRHAACADPDRNRPTYSRGWAGGTIRQLDRHGPAHTGHCVCVCVCVGGGGGVPAVPQFYNMMASGPPCTPQGCRPVWMSCLTTWPRSLLPTRGHHMVTK